MKASPVDRAMGWALTGGVILFSSSIAYFASKLNLDTNIITQAQTIPTFSYCELLNQVKGCESLMVTLKDISLNDFNINASAKLLKYSDLEHNEDAILLVKYYINCKKDVLLNGLGSSGTQVHIDVSNLDSTPVLL